MLCSARNPLNILVVATRRSLSTTHTAHADEREGAAMAALYYHPAAGKASLEAVVPSSPSLALRPSQSKVLCIGSSRWWMRRRWEGKARASGISSRARARARPVARPALFSPVAMEWQECTYVSLLLNLPDSSHPYVSSWDASPIFNLFLGLWVEFMQHSGSQGRKL